MATGTAILAFSGYSLSRTAPDDVMTRELIAGMTISSTCNEESGPPGPNDPYIACVSRKTTSAPWTAAALVAPLTGQAEACSIEPRRVRLMVAQAYDVMKKTAPDEASYRNAVSLYAMISSNARTLLMMHRGPPCPEVVQAFDTFDARVRNAAPAY